MKEIDLTTFFRGTTIYFLEEISGQYKQFGEPGQHSKLKFITCTTRAQYQPYRFEPFELNDKIYVKGNQSYLETNNICDYFDKKAEQHYEFWLVEESKNKKIAELHREFDIDKHAVFSMNNKKES